MIVSVFNKFGAKNSAPVFEAVAQAFRLHGHQVVEHDIDADAAVIWSFLWHGRMAPNRDIWRHFKADSRPVFVCEVGSISRNQTWRVGLDGCYLWEHFAIGDQPRFLAGLDPWRTSVHSVVIACQHQLSEQWLGMPSMNTWLENTIAEIRLHTDRPIIVRSHPRDPVSLRGVNVSKPVLLPNTYDDFDYARIMQDAHCVINWNSGAGITSLMQGVPVISSSNSLCQPISSTDLAQIESLPRPNRSSWFGRLGWTEWTLEEINQGRCLELLLPKAF